MAITFAERAELVDSQNITSYPTSAYQPSANSLLVACVYATGCTAADATFAGNGLTWTPEGALNSGVGQRMYVFSALTGSSPTNTAGTFDCTSDPATGVCIHISEFAGVDTTDAVTQIKMATVASAATATATFDAPSASTSTVLAAAAINATAPTLTPPTGYTETMDSGFTTPSTGLEVAYHLSPGVTNTVTWGNTHSAVGVCAIVEVKQGSVAAAPQLILVNSLGSV